MRELEILEQIESESSKNGKLAILQANSSNSKLRDLVHAALHFHRKFFIKKFDVSFRNVNSDDKHAVFMDLLNKLETRTVVGNEAISEVESFLSRCNLLQQKWYSRILRKDLRAGFSDKTAQKAGFNIPVFEVMLATDGKKCKKLNSLVQDGVWISPKLDGYRCIAVCDHGDVTLYSRRGSEFINFPSVQESLSVWSRDSRLVLDGEIMSDDFSMMQQSAFASKRGTTVGDVRFNVFDFVPFDEWMSGSFVSPKKNRLDNLKLLFKNKHNFDNLVMVEHELCHTVDQVKACEKHFMELGYEGAMAVPNIPYYQGRKANALIKFKTMQSQDCIVTGVYEGENKFEGTLGGLIVIQEDKVTECDVGSGFSDEERDWIWKHPDSVIDRIVEIKYQELGSKGKMRFPIFKRWRDQGKDTGKI